RFTGDRSSSGCSTTRRPAVEHAAAEAHARLRKEDRAAVLDLDRQREQRPERRRRDQADGGEREIEEALDHAARARPATRTKRSWYAATETRRSNRSAAARARWPLARVGPGSSYIAMMASASESGSPGVARRPQP